MMRINQLKIGVKSWPPVKIVASNVRLQTLSILLLRTRNINLSQTFKRYFIFGYNTGFHKKIYLITKDFTRFGLENCKGIACLENEEVLICMYEALLDKYCGEFQISIIEYLYNIFKGIFIEYVKHH